MNTFLSGGCKNGKSMFAQRLAFDLAKRKQVPLYYVATMISVDSEDDARIKRHREERAGWGFETIEQGLDVCDCLKKPNIDKKGIFLFDSVTALFANEMFVKGEINFDAKDKVIKDLCEFAKLTENTIFVSDFIYAEGRNFDEITLSYMEGLACIDKKLSLVCGNVIEYSYGIPFYYKREGI